MNEIIQVSQTDMLQAISTAEIDMQIATAKKYPRDTAAAVKNIADMAMLDEETAQDCFYVLHRNGANGTTTTIEGLSVRMAEIIASNWGNLRVATRIIGNDGKTITAQGICHDLQSNVAVSNETKRKITDKQGRTYSEDMQVVTGNAACAIAFRNAVLKVVPKAVLKKVIEEVRKMALGKSIDLETARQNAIAYFAKQNVTEEQILAYLGRDSRDAITQEDVYTLRATLNAIKEGTTTIAETFGKAIEDKKATAKVMENVAEVRKMTEKITKKEGK